MIKEEFLSTINRAQAFRDQTQNRQTEKSCFKKNLRQPPKSSCAILSHVSTQIEQVSIDVYTNARESHGIPFVVNTGSDWTVIDPDVLTRLGLKPQDLKIPTKQMQSTATATGEKMNPHGFIKAQLRFGNKKAQSDIAVFEGVTTRVGSIHFLKIFIVKLKFIDF